MDSLIVFENNLVNGVLIEPIFRYSSDGPEHQRKWRCILKIERDDSIRHFDSGWGDTKKEAKKHSIRRCVEELELKLLTAPLRHFDIKLVSSDNGKWSLTLIDDNSLRKCNELKFKEAIDAMKHFVFRGDLPDDMQ